MLIKRREAVKTLLYGSITLAAWRILVQEALANPKVTEAFPYGIASGDPTASSIVLWTRIEAKGQPDAINQHQPEEKVTWELSNSADFKNIIQTGALLTSPKKDFSVKVTAQHLKAGSVYYYRFKYRNVCSEPGRTKTLPQGPLNKVGFALASCSNYPFGFFNAYEAIAKDSAIDFIIHLGDYIYEYGPDGYGGKTGKTLGREHFPAHEIVSLTDYRQRHAQYKSDHSSRLMHATHPMIVIWDDHESTNNPYMEGAQNHQPDEGDWATRRDDSLQAYYEWMPIRDPQNNKDRAALWRAFDFGDLVTLLTLETRHTGRAKQIEYDDHLNNIKNEADLIAFKNNILGDTRREMLSKDMQAFAQKTLQHAKAKKQKWTVIGNQIPMARTLVPQLPSHLATRSNDDDPIAQSRAQFKRLGELRLPIYLDTWDGYPAARQRFYTMCQNIGINDLVVLTGDSHSFWLNQLHDDFGKPMGVELGTTGITSPGDFEEFGTEIAKKMDTLLAEQNTEIQWTDGLNRGYTRVVFTPKQVTVDFITVSTILSPNYSSRILRTARLHKNPQGISIS